MFVHDARAKSDGIILNVSVCGHVHTWGLAVQDPRMGRDAQVERLLQEATSHENLSQCYVGRCPFW